IAHEITENIGDSAVNFEYDGTMSSRFTRVVALYWLFVMPDDTATSLPFPTNAGTRSAYARIMKLNKRTIEKSIKSYDALMEQGLAYFSSNTRTRELKDQLKRCIHELSDDVCGL